jgi:hypothetical protein
MKMQSRGRPATEKGERSVSLRITLHPDEHAAILKASKDAGSKPVTWLRDLALKATK